MPRASPAVVHRADFYALDNALLRSKSTGIHLRRKPTILENDLSTPLIKWGTIVRGVNYVPDAEAVLDATAADEAVKEAELSLRDIYDRKIPIEQEPREWIVVKGIRNLRGKMDGVTKQWYIPFDITGVPILLKKDGMLSDDEDADEEEERAAKFVDLPAPTNSPPFALGSGMKYEVIYDSVVVRSSPSMVARPQSRETKGAIVEMFDWDETRKWRSVYDKNQRVGWMLLDHPEFGALLRPRCLPFQVRPVEPLTTAVLEEDLRWLRQFINKGLHVNTRDAGDRTPLMVAAEFRRHGPIVVLCAAGADASLQNFNGETAVDLARSEATKALIQALSDKQFNSERCQEAVSGLDGDVRELADDLLGKKIARMKFFQQDQKPNTGEAAKKPEPGPMQRRKRHNQRWTSRRWLYGASAHSASSSSARPSWRTAAWRSSAATASSAAWQARAARMAAPAVARRSRRRAWTSCGRRRRRGRWTRGSTSARPPSARQHSRSSARPWLQCRPLFQPPTGLLRLRPWSPGLGCALCPRP